jgi:hypothetical protein
MNKFIALFLLLNVPVCILQFLAFGIGINNGDAIGGTVGWGGKGNLAILIFLCTFCIIVRNSDKNKLYYALRRNKYLFLLWLPSFLARVKVSLLLIPLFFISLSKVRLKNILFGILGASIILFSFVKVHTAISNIGGGALPSTGFIYDQEVNMEYNIDKLQKLQNTRDYPMEAIVDSRTLRLLIGISLMENTLDWLIGKGIGHFKGSKTSQTKLASENQYLVTGSRSFILLMMLQVGIFGSIFVYYALFRACILHNEWRIRLFFIALILGISYYLVSFMSFYFCAIFFYATLSQEFTQKKDFSKLFNFLKEYSLPKKSEVLV